MEEYMSRQIDVNDPSSWDDDDRAYLAQRMDTVPAEHRADLEKSKYAPSAKVAVVEGSNPQMMKLTDFVRRNYPDRSNEDPVDVVISELGGGAEEDEEDDYDQWKVSELEAEARKRNMTEDEMPKGNDARQRQPWIDALRRWDAQH
jgi:hypothetical protein